MITIQETLDALTARYAVKKFDTTKVVKQILKIYYNES